MTKEYVYKRDKGSILVFCGIATVVFIIGLVVIISDWHTVLTNLKANPFAVVLSMGVFIIMFVGAWSMYLWDNAARLILNTQGVWTRKWGRVAWQDISSVHTEVVGSQFRSTLLYFQKKEGSKGVWLNINDLDATPAEILSTVAVLSSDYGVVILDDTAPDSAL